MQKHIQNEKVRQDTLSRRRWNNVYN